MQAQMLVPAAALVCWSLIVLLWMVITRFAGFGKAGIDLNKAPAGARGVNLEGLLPDRTMWKSHNYTHLMEQPTIFYPAVIILAILGATTTDVRLAWAYVAIRVVHSLWQGTVNRVPVRAGLFFVSTIILIVLAVRALMTAWTAIPGVVA
ncbi:MAG: MAPEG family protein [Novosphingobium sp.]